MSQYLGFEHVALLCGEVEERPVQLPAPPPGLLDATIIAQLAILQKQLSHETGRRLEGLIDRLRPGDLSGVEAELAELR